MKELLIKQIFLLKRFLYYFYGEKFFKRLKFNWHNYPSRWQMVQKIINNKKFKSYLEIGCAGDKTFSKIKIQTKVGVDPSSGGTHRMTSDEYFKKHQEKFDCIFIDGLHVYEQVRKDIINSLEVLNSHGIIIVHDCLPLKIWSQIVPQVSGNWSGDVWKAIVELRTFNYIDVYTCVADNGLGIILKRENRNILKLEIKNFKKLKYRNYYENINKFMNLISVSDIDKIISDYG